MSVFFFSSRRRHTRLVSDWSSDVCSSDLAGKHVLCEKLMAWDIASCKKMIAAAEKYDVALAIGHQRHYSLLYAHAQEVMASGVLGDVRHIRALWHRNNAQPKTDKDGKELEI